MKFGETSMNTQIEKQIASNVFDNSLDKNQEKEGGRIYLNEILKNIKNPQAKEFLLDSDDSIDVQAVLYGIKPTCWLNEKKAKLLEENIYLGKDIVIRGEVLFNRHLVIEVVKNNPDYFQDQKLDADKIIDNYFNSGKDEEQVSIQAGLLLGFPKKASEDYQRFNKKTKDLYFLEEIIPPNSPDAYLLKELIKVNRKYVNETFGRESECSIISQKIYDQTKYLLYKYLPRSEADLSWERFQGKYIRAGGIVWMEWCSTQEGEDLKNKYRRIFDDAKYKVKVQEALIDLCKEFVNKNVLETLDEKNIIEIKNLAKTIKYKYSKNSRGIRLSDLLSKNFNSINGQPIDSADDLIQYLKMQKDAYEKELK